MPVDKEQVIRAIVAQDGRYAINAYEFTLEALSYTIRAHHAGARKHIACKELIVGFAEYGAEVFGFLVSSVFKQWGVKTGKDVGNVVFNMIAKELLTKSESDTIEEFDDSNVQEMADALASKQLEAIAI